MLIGHSRPSGITWTVSGTGATIVTTTGNLGDGLPDTLSRFTFNTGMQSTSTVLRLRADWAGAIGPGLVGLSNISLPAGTKITVSFRRAGDTAGTYPYAPTLLNTGNLQRVYAQPRGEQTAWLIVPAGATPVIGCEIQIWNDVNGTAAIVAGAPFTIGEAVIASTTELCVSPGITIEPGSPGTINQSGSKQVRGVPDNPFRTLSFKLATADQTAYIGGALDQLLAKIDRLQSAVYIARYRDPSGAFSEQLLHNFAMIGAAQKLPAINHIEGKFFGTGQMTVVESPIPV